MLRILFICTHNRCRSILAEAIFNHFGNGVIQAQSAGSAPAGEIHPKTLEHLEQHGISTAGLMSESWNSKQDYAADLVITVCDSAAGESCPLWMGNTPRIHWGLRDPSRINDSEKACDRAFNECIAILESRIKQILPWLNSAVSKAELLARISSLA